LPCYRPMPLNVNSREILVPCGKCIGCKLQRSQNWATRIMHEAAYQESMGRENCCALLTYNDENLPYTDNNLPTLHKRDLQLFIKRLRKEIGNETHIKYFAAGEYGDDMDRPHYHIAIMGVDFGDKESNGKSPAGSPLYRSEQLDRIWGMGITSIMDLNYESAGYIARYCTKKITGSNARSHYNQRTPEFSLQSNRPAIGLEWFERYHQDIYTSDTLSIRKGIKVKPPRYYDKLFKSLNIERYEYIKCQREIARDNTIGRKGFPNLKNREIHQTARINHLKRSYENGDTKHLRD